MSIYAWKEPNKNWLQIEWTSRLLINYVLKNFEKNGMTTTSADIMQYNFVSLGLKIDLDTWGFINYPARLGCRAG